MTENETVAGRAFISGEARRAVLEVAGEWLLLDGPEAEPRPLGFLREPLGEGRDRYELEGATIAEVRHQLASASFVAVLLSHALPCLDNSVSTQVRRRLVPGLDEMLTRDDGQKMVERVLWSTPLPKDADPEGAIAASKEHPAARAMFLSLVEKQPSIAHVEKVVEAEISKLPEGVREVVVSAMVRTGHFRTWVERGEVDEADLLQAIRDALLSSPVVGRLRDQAQGVVDAIDGALSLQTVRPGFGAQEREAVGRKVRETWVVWASKQVAPKPSWLLPWEALDEPSREVDRQIGEALYTWGMRDAWELADRNIEETVSEKLRAVLADRTAQADPNKVYVSRMKWLVARVLLSNAKTVQISLDARRSGVIVPPFLANESRLVLEVGSGMAIPIPDLMLDEEGVSATLSFNRKPFKCKVPWTAIFSLEGIGPNSGASGGRSWPHDMPPEVIEHICEALEGAVGEAKLPEPPGPKKTRTPHLRVVK